MVAVTGDSGFGFYCSSLVKPKAVVRLGEVRLTTFGQATELNVVSGEELLLEAWAFVVRGSRAEGLAGLPLVGAVRSEQLFHLTGKLPVSNFLTELLAGALASEELLAQKLKTRRGFLSFTPTELRRLNKKLGLYFQSRWPAAYASVSSRSKTLDGLGLWVLTW